MSLISLHSLLCKKEQLTQNSENSKDKRVGVYVPCGCVSHTRVYK